MACDPELVTTDDLKKLKRQADFISEVGTGDTTATNPDTGMTVPTIPAIVENSREFVDSPDDTFTTLNGTEKPTVTGIANAANTTLDGIIADAHNTLTTAIDTFETESQAALDAFDANQTAALTNAGYNVVGNFADGATLTSLGDAIYYAGDPANEGFYAWTGTFPKVVTAGSTPFDESGWMLAATGYTKQSGAIQLFGQTIEADIAIPSNQNALSINPTVADGVTVTVPAGSTYVVLGSTS